MDFLMYIFFLVIALCVVEGVAYCAGLGWQNGVEKAKAKARARAMKEAR